MMAHVEVSYTWPEGGEFTVSISTKVNNVEALAAVRIEVQRLWAAGLAELEKADAPSDG